MDDTADPTPEELSALTHFGRLARLLDQGFSPVEAATKLTEAENAEGYAERNRAAMTALEERMLSPEYLARFAAAQCETDPAKKAAAHAALKRENFAAVDMEAVHRTISSRNRQMQAEGMLPPHLPL